MVDYYCDFYEKSKFRITMEQLIIYQLFFVKNKEILIKKKSPRMPSTHLFCRVLMCGDRRAALAEELAILKQEDALSGGVSPGRGKNGNSR
jgi:hypothetical protein